MEYQCQDCNKIITTPQTIKCICGSSDFCSTDDIIAAFSPYHLCKDKKQGYIPRMKQGDNYCGYSCTAEKEEIQKVIDRTIEFSKVNPEWGLIMLGKFTEMIYDARLKLSQKMTKWPGQEKDPWFEEKQ